MLLINLKFDCFVHDRGLLHMLLLVKQLTVLLQKLIQLYYHHHILTLFQMTPEEHLISLNHISLFPLSYYDFRVSPLSSQVSVTRDNR